MRIHAIPCISAYVICARLDILHRPAFAFIFIRRPMLVQTVQPLPFACVGFLCTLCKDVALWVALHCVPTMQEKRCRMPINPVDYDD